MPRIKDWVTHCVIYLYQSENDADEGAKNGGTGFLVETPSAHKGLSYVTAVTNRHVIEEEHAPVIRLNTKDGQREILPVTEGMWRFHPAGFDIAAVLLGLSRDKYELNAVPERFFLSTELIDDFGIGLGDDLYLTGRFINHEGKQKNWPTVRFGTIAMMNNEEIVGYRDKPQESFLIEVRTIGGYSGSPAFVMLDNHRWAEHPNYKHLADRRHLQWLLGIEYGNFLVSSERVYYRRDGQFEQHEELVTRANTGISAVLPAWEILRAVHHEDFDKMRKESDKEISRKKAQSPVTLTGSGGKQKRKTRDIEISPIGREKFFEKLIKATERKN